MCLIRNFLFSTVNNVTAFDMDTAVKGKNIENFESNNSECKYMLKCYTNIVMMSSGQSEDYRSRIVSYNPEN